MCVCVCFYTHTYIYTHTPIHVSMCILSLSAEKAWEEWQPNSSKQSSVQILVSKYYTLLEGTRAPWENGWDRESMNWASDFLCEKENKGSKNDEHMSKVHRREPEGPATSSTRANLKIEILMIIINNNPVNKMGNHESIVI